MSFGIVASVGGSLLGGMMSAGAASDAAGMQAQSGRDSLALQKEMFDKNNSLQEPFRQNGLNASNRLQQLMGLGMGSGSGSSGIKTADQLRSELLGQYTTGTPGGGQYVQTLVSGGADDGTWYEPRWQEGTQQTIDEAGLSSAIQRRMAEQEQQQAQQQQGVPTDPEYGSLAKKFTLADFTKDPGYDFRLQEGQKGVENSAAARGGLLSGAAMKAMQKYGQDFASNEYGNAYNRFNNDQTTQFNRLSGMAGSGQQAANQLGNAATNFGQSGGNTLTGIGNANASGAVGGANAWGSAIGGAINNYQSNQLMDMIRKPGSSVTFDGTGAWRQ